MTRRNVSFIVPTRGAILVSGASNTPHTTRIAATIGAVSLFFANMSCHVVGWPYAIQDP